MAEIDRIGFAKVLEKAIDEALDGPKHIYVSLDIDVLDPAFAPGTGYVTTMNARRTIFETLTGITQRKLGITERNFLDPAAAGLDPPKR